MNSKTQIILVTIALFLFLVPAFYFLGFPYKLIVVFGILIVFMEIALLDPPRKHHEFSPQDSRQAVNRVLGLNIGTTDSSEVGSEYLKKKIESGATQNQTEEK